MRLSFGSGQSSAFIPSTFFCLLSPLACAPPHCTASKDTLCPAPLPALSAALSAGRGGASVRGHRRGSCWGRQTHPFLPRWLQYRGLPCVCTSRNSCLGQTLCRETVGPERK